MALVRRKPIEGEVSKSTSPYGRVYVFELVMEDGTVIYKVGMVNSDSMSRVTDRLMEVLRSFFMQYRYVPTSKIVKAKKYLVPYYVETHLHHLLDDLKYRPDKKYDGYNEMFTGLDVEALTSYMDEFEYGELLRGETSMDEGKCSKIGEAIALDKLATSKKGKAKEEDKLSF